MQGKIRKRHQPTTRLTEAMVLALRIAKADGRVVAGLSVARCGRSAFVASSTIRGLERRGLVSMMKCDCNDDCKSTAAELTDSGRDTLTLLSSGHGLLIDLALKCMKAGPHKEALGR